MYVKTCEISTPSSHFQSYFVIPLRSTITFVNSIDLLPNNLAYLTSVLVVLYRSFGCCCSHFNFDFKTLSFTTTANAFLHHLIHFFWKEKKILLITLRQLQASNQPSLLSIPILFKVSTFWRPCVDAKAQVCHSMSTCFFGSDFNSNLCARPQQDICSADIWTLVALQFHISTRC